MKIGYACINLSLPCISSKTFRLKSFSKERFLKESRNNLDCLMDILEWNKENKIFFFRITSELIPFASHPICDVKWQNIFKKDFARMGAYIKNNKMRISMHPGHFTIINSLRQEVIDKSIKDLEYHNDVMDLLKLDDSHKMQIHVGGVYGDKEESKKRFIENYNKLSLQLKKRLVLENDDKYFSCRDCLEISNKTGIPILFDVFHHHLLNNGESDKEMALLASKTWRKKDGIFMVDFSSQAKGKRIGAHSYYINEESFTKFLNETKCIEKDIMIESKGKEKSVLKLNKFYGKR
jgi:UV DNA damage endonuclease